MRKKSIKKNLLYSKVCGVLSLSAYICTVRLEPHILLHTHVVITGLSGFIAYILKVMLMECYFIEWMLCNLRCSSDEQPFAILWWKYNFE